MTSAWYMQDYRRLRVWGKAHALVLNVRNTTHRFPRTGYSSLKSQVTRTAESVPFNIVEGCGSHSQKDFARFLEISIKSTSELEYQLLLAKDDGILSPEKWKSLTDETIDTRRMLCGLRAKVKSPINRAPWITEKRTIGSTPNSKRAHRMQV